MWVTSLITTFNPGQSPPHVTIAAITFLGSKWICLLGPPFKKYLELSYFKVLIIFSQTNLGFLTKELLGNFPSPPYY